MKKPISIACMLIGLAAQGAFGQTAQITGRVTDASDAVVPGVEVSVTNSDTGVTRTAASNESGYYSVPLLPQGNYRVRARMAGFKTIERTGLVLDEGQVLRVDFGLQVGEVTESVEVVGAPSLVDTTTTAVSTVVSNQKIVDMPMLGRNFMALAQLVPGVRGIGNYTGLPVDSWDSSRASIGGGAPSSNNYMVDGIASEAMTSGGFNVLLSVDATEEFRIISRNASAEYGRTGGGVVNVVSRSGANAYHGSLYEFLRNRALNANGWFSNRAGRDDRPPYTYNQYGATLGGRIVRDRTFFFFNWEQVRERQGTRQFRTVPTALQRTGDFSQTRAASGAVIRVFDPYSTRLDPANPSRRLRDQFPGNVIPASRISPISRAVAAFYPLPNTTGAAGTEANNFLGGATNTVARNVLGIKIDHNFTQSRRLSGRFTYDATSRVIGNVYGNVAEISTPGSDFPRRSVALNYTDALRPDLLLEARAGVNRYTTFRIPRSYGYDFTQLGLPASLKAQVEYLLFPRFTPTGMSAIGTVQNDLIRQANDAWSAAAAVTKIRTGHVIKFGWEHRLYRYNNSQSGPVLDFAFAPTFTRGPDPNVASATAGYGFATFLLGTPTSGSSARTRPVTDSLQSIGLFLQDDWKLTPKLTLNLGLRWEFEGAIKDRFNVISNFDPNVETRAGGVTLRGGLIYPGVNGVPRGNRDNSWNDFGPRFGFAYQVLPKTVVRGGFGLFYLPTHGTFVRLGTTGFNLTTNIVTSVDGGFTPYDTLANPFPQGIQSPPGSSLGTLTGLGTSVAGNLRGIRSGYSEQWNLNVQRDLPGKWLLEVAYLGNHGVSLPANQVYAYLPEQYLSLGTQLQELAPNPFAGLITVGTLSQPSVTRATLLRRFPQFTGASGIASWANSIYHAMTVRLEKRMSRGFSLLLAYTNSKLIDDNLGNGANDNFSEGGSNAIQNWNNLRAERAISTSDVPQRLVVSPSWELPLARGRNRWYRAIAGGWQIHSMLTLQSGDPMAVTAQAPAFGGNRPNVAGDPNAGQPSIDRWFNTSAFTVIPPFTYGNGPRNLPGTRTDGLFNWDLAGMKNVTIRERVRLQFRAEFFNFTNTATFGAPGQVLTDPDFGVVSAVSNPARRIQFALKLYF